MVWFMEQYYNSMTCKAEFTLHDFWRNFAHRKIILWSWVEIGSFRKHNVMCTFTPNDKFGSARNFGLKSQFETFTSFVDEVLWPSIRGQHQNAKLRWHKTQNIKWNVYVWPSNHLKCRFSYINWYKVTSLHAWPLIQWSTKLQHTL